jgi:enterochelin esterase-like enzyme
MSEASGRQRFNANPVLPAAAPGRLRPAARLALLALCSAATALAQPVPEVTTGRIERLPAIASKFVDPRPVDVWLPADYSAARRYKVLYMHDGQMLFDAAKSWNKQAWDVHLALARLRAEGRIADTIVVGVWNNGRWRHSEYYPQKFLPFLAEPLRTQFVDNALHGKPQADAYLRFLVEELKPAIDRRYATRPEREHTVVMGSSMGGLISIYAMNEYPQVFGAAAGLSTHWVGSFEANSALPLAAFNYLSDKLADPAGHRLYMDHGTTELDALYPPYQRFVDQIVKDRGYTAANSLSRVFEGTGHNERAWAARLELPLLFLLGTPP